MVVLYDLVAICKLQGKMAAMAVVDRPSNIGDDEFLGLSLASICPSNATGPVAQFPPAQDDFLSGNLGAMQGQGPPDGAWLGRLIAFLARLPWKSWFLPGKLS